MFASAPRLLVASLLLAACGSSFQVPARPDMRVDRDLASKAEVTPVDMTCFNTACGGCSEWARPDGTPARAGDPCLWNGVLQCNASGQLSCLSTQCIACASGTPTGTLCGADGRSIIVLAYNGSACISYSFGASIGVCNHSATDTCLHRCVQDGMTVRCTARCTDTDGGVSGCPHADNQTCTTLLGC